MSTSCDCLVCSEIDHEYHGDPNCKFCGGTGFVPDFDDPIAVRWVRQEDPMGCWVAAMAMVTGKTYAEVKAETGRMAEKGGHCWATDQYLAQNGFAIKRYWKHDQFKGRVSGEAWRNDEREPWPLAPFAPLHVCQVQTSRAHMVVMLADGTVLDPASPQPKRLSDYTDVQKIVGIWKVGRAA